MNKIFEEEKQYLENVLVNITREIEFCDKELREIPKRYTKALQGDSFLVEALMTVTATKQKRLEMSQSSPYFGRIDFYGQADRTLHKIYIGKTTVTDESNNILTTDWRAPICSLYYDSNLGPVSYDSPSGTIFGNLELKRQILIKEGSLIDVLDTSLISNDELLQPYLSVNADNKMKTIIASIQREQNQIIRKSILQNIIVQGVAGSGKTSVALHRIAYLVYALGDKIRSNQILTIGPNKYFLNYISSILPELEVEPVNQKTYLDLLNEILKEKFSFKDDALGDDSNDELFKKVQNFKSSLECRDALDRFLNDFILFSLVPEGISFDGEVVFDVDTIRKVLIREGSEKPNYDSACSYFIKFLKEHEEEIYDKLNEKYRKIYINLPKGDKKRDDAIAKSIALSTLLKNNGAKVIREFFKKIKLKPADIYELFIKNIERYTSIFTEEEIETIKREYSISKRKITFEDIPSILHINNRLYGHSSQYRYIVIDEAQDYGLFHFSVLKDMFPNSSFSIYGDLAQSIYSYRGISNWESVIENIFTGDCELLKLNKSYRTTIEVTNVANRILNKLNISQAEPVIRHGEEISYMDCSFDDDYKVAKIKEWINKGYLSIAVICKNDKEAKTVYNKLLKKGLNISHITSKNEQYNGGVFVITSALAKGLEFDAVLINDASSNIYSEDSEYDMHLLYVSCTRALHELEILYDKELCSVFSDTFDRFDEIKARQRIKKD